MFKTPELLQTEPEGKPADDVGMFLIERLFTNVVHTLSDVIFEPTINVLAHEATLLHCPPKTPEKQPVAKF